VQILPTGVSFFQPADGVRRAARSFFDAAMPCIGCPVNGAGFGQFRVCKEAFDVIVQGTLIAFERENIIGFLRRDFRGNSLLCSHGIDRYNRALDRQHVQKLGDRLDLVAFPIDGALPDDQPCLAGISREKMQRPAPVRGFFGAAQRFAVNRYHATRDFLQRSNSRCEAFFQNLRLRQPENLAEGLRMGNAGLVGQKLFQPAQIFAA
jgi:hypothetical protein